MVDILCLWGVLMDIMEYLSVGRYWMAIFWHFVFPVTFPEEIGLAVEYKQDRLRNVFLRGIVQ